MMAWGLILIMACGSLADAASIQYLNDSSALVTAAVDNGLLPDTLHNVATVTGPASAIQWPAPAGCGTAGKPDWTRIVDPAAVTAAGGGMGLIPGVAFFTSTSPDWTNGCVPVVNKREVERVVSQALLNGLPSNSIITTLNVHWGWYYARCGDDPGNANCATWKANLNTMLTLYPGRGQGITESGEGAQLATDMVNFLNAQCTAQPGGPFC